MKPIKFEEQNVVFGENQLEYNRLPAFLDDGSDGIAVICMKLSFLERVQVLFSGKVWISQMTFHRTLQPIFSSVFKDDVIPSRINFIRWIDLLVSDIKERIQDRRIIITDEFPRNSLN